jgi:hypothetical protein
MDGIDLEITVPDLLPKVLQAQNEYHSTTESGKLDPD